MRFASNARILVLGSLLCAATSAAAQESDRLGTSAFCLFELPGGDKRLLINLAIVQYVEVARNEVKIAYGGGNFGSGHVARLPAKTPEERDALLARLKKTARACQEKTP
jgi:hypothetical protein